jgi:hypothetical protein
MHINVYPLFSIERATFVGTQQKNKRFDYLFDFLNVLRAKPALTKIPGAATLFNGRCYLEMGLKDCQIAKS